VNNRRKLVIALGASALAAPFVSFAQQQGKAWRIGFFGQNESRVDQARLEAFKAGMSALGYAEGRDYLIEFRSGYVESVKLASVAAEFVALKVDMIISTGTPTVVAANLATREIPIVTTTAGDVVGIGLAKSLARPGGNVTGLTNLSLELISKRLDLLRQFVPSIRRVGLLFNPENQSNAQQLEQFGRDCGKLRMTAIPAPSRSTEDIAGAFRLLVREKAQGLIVPSNSTNNTARRTIAERAITHRLPAGFSSGEYAEAGGLFSYASDFLDLNRRAAAYADKIIKGAKPGDLPIEQPTKFEMVLNVKTAKALGLKISNSILVQATRVIE
jgi:putative ABC transport system substrate-binding protein